MYNLVFSVAANCRQTGLNFEAGSCILLRL